MTAEITLKDMGKIELYLNTTEHSKAQTMCIIHGIYRKVSNIRHTFVGNKIVDHSDVVGASPVGAAPTTSSFSN